MQNHTNTFPLFFTTSRGKISFLRGGNFQLSLMLWGSTLMSEVAKNLILLLLLHCIDSFQVLGFLGFFKDDLTAGRTYISSLTNHKQIIPFYCTVPTMQTQRWLHFLLKSWLFFFCFRTDVIPSTSYTCLRIPARPSYTQSHQFQAQLQLINQCWQQYIIILRQITRMHPNFWFSTECSKAKNT